jgi:hypothetical protein
MGGKSAPYCGVIEGFYGARWTHADRLALLDALPGWGMNLYIYSARNDPYHRYGWAIPYPHEERRRFEELAERAARRRVQLAIGLSPGPDYDHTRRDHRRLLLRKLDPFVRLGCRLFPIFYDGAEAPVDFQSPSGAAHGVRQAAVLNDLADALAARAPGARVLTCPAEFGSARPSAYLSSFHQRLDAGIMVMCTSVDDPDPRVRTWRHCPQTWPRTYSNEGAARYARTFGRKPFLWDNFNCVDFALNRLNWSPYQGRGDRLPELCSGIVLNPQNIGLLNWPVLGTAGAFFADPRRYDPRRAMARSLRACLGPAGAAIGRILSQWFTTEWCGYLSASENLPRLPPGLGKSMAARRRFLRRVRQAVAPLRSLHARFNRTLMPPDWACHLDAYVRLLQAWACAVDGFCEEGLETDGFSRSRIRDTARALAGLRQADNRLPDSLLDYLEQLLATGGRTRLK